MENLLKKTISKNIKNRRKSLGMKQKHIADELGVMQNSISRMESGKYFISIPKLKKVCKILKCSYLDIIGDSNLKLNIIDLNKLFKLFREKKLHYIDVTTNGYGYFRAFASSGYNGRGDSIEIVVKDIEAECTTEIKIFLLRCGKEPIEDKVLSEDIAFELIEKF